MSLEEELPAFSRELESASRAFSRKLESASSASASPAAPEKSVLGVPVQVLTETVQGVRQWSLAVLLGVEAEECPGDQKSYRISFGTAEETVPSDRVRFFPAAKEPASPEDLYRQGMKEAEQVYGDEVRDYDRILHGLCRVVAARGLTITPLELAEYFHSPLVSCSCAESFEKIFQALHTAVTAPPGSSAPNWDQQQVLKRQLCAYRRYQPLDELVDEGDLTRHHRSLQDALTANPEFRGTLPHRLALVRRDAQRIHRACAIVAALLGQETQQLRSERDFADELLAAATDLETRLRAEITAVDDRLAALPVERAEALHPIRELRLKRSAFEGNTVRSDASYISDKHLLIRKEAITRRDRAERLTARKHRQVTDEHLLTAETCERTFRRAVEGASQDAVLLGYFEYVRRAEWKPYKVFSRRLAVAVTSGDEVVYLDADIVRFIDSLVGEVDSLKMRIREAGPGARNPQRRAAYDPVVFFRRGDPVAVLMPLNYNRADIPFDVATARGRLMVQTWLELGKQVPWMELAEIPFGPENFRFCPDVDDLITQLLKTESHELGAAYVLGDICFINLNSRPGEPEEWLLIRGSTAIGNIPLRVCDDLGDLEREVSAQKIRHIVELLRTATEEQCAASDFIDLL